MSAVAPAAGPRLRVAITGASGLIGSALAEALERDGHAVRRLVRSGVRPERGDISWDPAAGRIQQDALGEVDAVVHLAGENLGRRWTSARRARIRDSRIGSTRLLAQALAALPRPPHTLVSASAIGYYGDRGDERLDEHSPPGDDFLGRLSREWEAAAAPAVEAGVRVVHPRFGVVLSARGGALPRMLPVFRLGLGGRLGPGHQWLSWVALADAVAALRFAIDTPKLSGPINVVSPEPVTNVEFTRALGRALGRPTPFAVPTLALRLVFGEMAEATLLASQRAVPERLLGAGFQFQYPQLDAALRAALADR